MAKRKRAPHEKPFSRPMQKPATDAVVTETTVSEATVAEETVAEEMTAKATGIVETEARESGGDEAASVDTSNAVTRDTGDSTGDDSTGDGSITDGPSGGPIGGISDANVADRFIGQWNRLISTTNWEKGQIICDWREALFDSGVAVTEYSDEAWAQLVGGVTSQHVGRLRRVSQRFGAAFQQYEGLHWSHFQACLDWEDAEMWLEGSIQNGWSVSQMRGKRWETVGTTPEEQQAEVALVAAEQASEAEAEDALENQEAAEDAPSRVEVSALDEGVRSGGGEATTAPPSSGAKVSTDSQSADQVNKRTRLSVDVESLPDDLAEAFESFKLAIIAHRRENWRDTTPESVVECLESLKQLATAAAE